MPTVDADLLRGVESFVYHETQLADENRYEDWERLWAEDGVYWVPLAPGDDPYRDTSIIFDNRRRIAIRVRQLSEGRRPTQTPASRVRRVVSNVQLLDLSADMGLPERLGPSRWDVGACANFVGVEAHQDRRNLIAGRTTYGLRRADDSFLLVFKRVELVDSDLPLRTLSFVL